jgi:DNA-binding response OmpR family regulator
MNKAPRARGIAESTQLSVLVVDNEKNFLNLMAMVLSKEGYHVITAGDGIRALAHAEREKFALAILDINMEPMTGVEILSELKKRDPMTQVVIVTGCQTEETRSECVRLGAGAYLTKPIEMSELKAALRDLLGAGQLLHST